MQQTVSRRKLAWYVTILIAMLGLLGSGVVATATPARAATPAFQMPFPCGQVWRASTYSGHDAIDWNFYPEDSGRAVVASAAGTASLVYEANYGGYMVVIDHGGGWQTVYAHLQQDGRASGQVAMGQTIGYVGSTGSSTAPHLHWEQKLNGVRQVPLYANGVALSPGPSADQSAPAYTSNNCGSPVGGGSFSDDAKADVLWYESNNNGTAKLIKTNSTGTGGEAPNVWFSGYAKPTWAGHGDFNGDGKTDLAWYESWNNGTMKVLLSNGTGFSSTHTWFTGYAAPTKAYVGDFTGDGKDDIGWYESWNNGGTLKVIYTASNGISNGGSYTWLSGFANPDWSDAGDLNGDGKDDLAWFEGWNNGSLKVIYSSGSGTSSIATWFTGYAKPTWAAIGNFTGGPDKKEDLAWYESWNNGTLKVIPSNGNSSGTPITWFSGYATPTLAFAADINGDGRSDIGWYEASNNGTMKVILTNSAGTGGASSHTWFSGFAKPDWAGIG